MRNPTYLRNTLAFIGVSTLIAGCLAPPEEEQGGTLADMAGMMAADGAASVSGTLEDGQTANSTPIGDGGIVAPENAVLAAEGGAEPPGGAIADDPDEEWPDDEDDYYEEDPYVEFGERIIVRDVEGTTFVTKPYNLPIGRAEKVVKLMKALQPFDFAMRPEAKEGELPPLNPDRLEYEVLAGFDDEYLTDFKPFNVPTTAATPMPLADLLVVTATPRLLVDFEEFLDTFAGGGVPQIELEAKIIEISETNSFDVGVSPNFLFGSTNFLSAASVSLPNFTGSAEALLTLGAVQDGVSFDAILEVVEGWQNVSIDTRPKTVVRAGGVAHIEARTEIPFLQFKTLDAKGFFTTSTAYKKIGVELWISPRMVGSNTLALDVRIEGSQRIGSQAILSTSGESGASIPIEVPVIAYRTAKTVVHLKPGQTLMIGGLTQDREQEIVSQVPLLGDLPLIGWLFRSTFKTVERQHVIFAVSPRIVQHSDFLNEW